MKKRWDIGDKQSGKDRKMAFFDEIGKKITDGGQKAAEQARIFAEVNRLNGQVSEQERLISQFYTQIGKDYYEAHTEDPEECVQVSVEGINAAKQKIEELKAQIIAVKGAVTCPKCGAEISKGTVFCPQCGEKIPPVQEAPVPADMVKCPNCGNAMQKGQKFCIHCGTALPTEPIVEMVEVESTSANICPGCGSEVEPGTRFCMTCGQKLD